MKFIEYKNNLEKCGLKLFDYDYRISYYNMKLLTEKLIKNQIGGDNSFYVKPFVILKKTENRNNHKKVKLLIENLLSNNFTGAEYLCKNDIKLNYF